MTGPRPVATRRISAVSVLRLAVGTLRFDRDAFRRGNRLGDLGAGQRLDPLLLERLLELRRHRLVLDRDEPRQQFDDGDLAAEATVDGGELHPDGAAAHDDERLRNSSAGGSPRRW